MIWLIIFLVIICYIFFLTKKNIIKRKAESSIHSDDMNLSDNVKEFFIFQEWLINIFKDHPSINILDFTDKYIDHFNIETITKYQNEKPKISLSRTRLKALNDIYIYAGKAGTSKYLNKDSISKEMDILTNVVSMYDDIMTNNNP